MTETLTYTMNLTALTCGTCEIPFAMPADMLSGAKRDGRFFWCPNGHKIHYAKTENDKLREELASAGKRLANTEQNLNAAWATVTHEQDQRRAAERSASAYKGQATRLRKRSSAGVCPVPDCHRHFENLARHMHTKHPDFAESDRA